MPVWGSLPTDASSIATLTKLETLALPLLKCSNSVNLVQAILSLQSLENLSISLPDAPSAQSLSKFSNLKDLFLCKFGPDWSCRGLGSALSELTLLTRLFLHRRIQLDCGSCLKNLTSLVDLCFNPGPTSKEQLVEMLIPLERLEYLEIDCRSLSFPSQALQRMKCLKSLSITCHAFDDNLGMALAQLVLFTHLHVHYPTVIDTSLLSQINAIHGLQHLVLWELPVLSPFPILDGRQLQKLRYLELRDDTNLDQTLLSKIRQELPQLRRLIAPGFT